MSDDWRERERIYLREYYAELAGMKCEAIGRDHNAHFELKAQLFYNRFGYLPPGKSDPLRTDENKAKAQWQAYLDSGMCDSDLCDALQAKLSEVCDE